MRPSRPASTGADLRNAERLDAWFDRIVVNECRARLRRRTVRVLAIADPAEPPGPDPFGQMLEWDVLHRALAGLGPDHRIAVVLRYVAELTPAEIATRTGEREGTVKSRLHYDLQSVVVIGAGHVFIGGRDTSQGDSLLWMLDPGTAGN